MATYLDVGQWLSLVSGYRSKTNLPQKSSAKIKEFLKAAQSDIRDIIETSTPVMFVLDTRAYKNALNIFIDGLKAGDPNYTRFVKEVVLNGYEVLRDYDGKSFLDELKNKLSGFVIPQSVIKKEIVVKNIVTKRTDFNAFSDAVSSVLGQLNRELEADFISQTGKAITPERARRKTVAAGRLLRRKFNELTPCALNNPETLVVNFDSEHQEILIGVNFSSFRDRLNSYLNAEINKAFKDFGIILSEKDDKSNNLKRFGIGELVVFGHTGAKTVDNGVAQLIGINTPWTQQLMLLAAQKGVKGEVFSVLNGFARDSGQLDLSVQFTKEVSEKVGVLLKGQISIVVPITSQFNKTILEKETAAANALVESIFGKGSTYRKVRGSLIDRVLDANNLLKLVTGLRFSPTLVESIEKNVIQLLKTGKSTSVKATSKKETFNIIKNESAKVSVDKNAKKYKLPNTKTKPKQSVSKVPRAETNLIDLVSLINSKLHDQIKANMGTGDRRDVLNYQTGRFAKSAKVERVSESRAGMITAFYSYMKNPYATFSQGGQQESPRSRDPKLLIAKSIREIAQTQVTNRLRAVNV